MAAESQSLPNISAPKHPKPPLLHSSTCPITSSSLISDFDHLSIKKTPSNDDDLSSGSDTDQLPSVQTPPGSSSDDHSSPPLQTNSSSSSSSSLDTSFVTPKQQTSYLPQWLLDSKLLSENLRRKSLDSSLRLKSLTTTIQAFSNLIETSLPIPTSPTPPPPAPSILLNLRLGNDAASVCLQFLDIEDCINYGAASKECYQFVHVSRLELWKTYFDRHCLSGYTWNEYESDVSAVQFPSHRENEAEAKTNIEDQFYIASSACRAKCLSHAQSITLINTSFQNLKRNRSRTRPTSIDPLIFDKKRDKTISHPMPIRGGLIMSHVATSCSETRKEVLHALLRMSFVTANPNDTVTCNSFLDNGVITMLIALLANESGAIKEASCLNLANLIVTPPRNQSSAERRRVLMKEVYLSNGPSALAALLSSPCARVNLHNNTLNSAAMDRLSSMRCQSLATMHASRALINIFLHPLEICSHGEGRKETEKAKGEDLKLPVITSTPVEKKRTFANPPADTVVVIRRGGVEFIPIANQNTARCVSTDELSHLGPIFTSYSAEMKWTCFYFYSSGSLKDRHDITMTLASNGIVAGNGVDDSGEFVLEGETDTAFKVTSFGISKTYTHRGANPPKNGHISHLLYYSPGDILGSLSSGLYGVWETVTSSEYGYGLNVKKGGVARMIPSCLIEGIDIDVDPFDISNS